jgi:hypothetical protein
MTHKDEVSDAMLMALADGELNDLDAARLRQRLAADPNLAARHEAFVRTSAWMKEAFPPAPVPDRLIAAVLNAPEPAVGVAGAVPLRRRFRQSGWGVALAASLLMGIGGFWAGRSSAPQGAGSGNPAVATAALPTGGETRLPDRSTARVLASYETDLGLCRMIAQDAWRHIACRDDQSGAWDIALSVHAGEDGRFMPSSAVAVELIDRLLDDVNAGPPLGDEEERRALQR